MSNNKADSMEKLIRKAKELIDRQDACDHCIGYARDCYVGNFLVYKSDGERHVNKADIDEPFTFCPKCGVGL